MKATIIKPYIPQNAVCCMDLYIFHGREICNKSVSNASASASPQWV